MPHTIATQHSSTKEQRRSRKRRLWQRIRRDVRRFTTGQQASLIIQYIRADISELIEIGHIEGFQSGVNTAKAAQSEVHNEQPDS